MTMLVHHFLTESAARYPDKTALIAGESTLSFGQMAARAGAVAAILQRQGLKRGERLALVLDNSIEMVVGVFAGLMAGGVVVPIHPATKPAKLAYIFNDCQVRIVVAAGGLDVAVGDAVAASPSVQAVLWAGEPKVLSAGRINLSLAEAMAAAAVPADPQLIDVDLAAIIYTSGSTGEPKGVMLTHRNLCNTAWSISTYLGNRSDDVVICVMPLSFDYGLYQVLTGARLGFTVVLEKGFAYPRKVLERMSALRVTGLPGVPTLFAMILQQAPFRGLDLSALRYMTNTAAALPPAHIRGLRQVLPHACLFAMYGLTECTRVSYLDPERLDAKIGSVGKAIPNSETYIVDGQGNRLPAGEVGELVIRGSNVMRGYWGKPEATAQRLRDGDIPGEKVLYSGDLFRKDADGFLYFVGRRDDVFKCRGEKVSPAEIEHVLCELVGVVEAAVLPVPHETDGSAIKAVVVPRDGTNLTEAQIRLHCRARLDPHLVPRFIEMRAGLPRSENGKVRKSQLVAPVSPAAE